VDVEVCVGVGGCPTRWMKAQFRRMNPKTANAVLFDRVKPGIGPSDGQLL
jgi:hypothetical protein